MNIKQHLKIELFGLSMDALTAATIADQGQKVVDQGHGAMDNLEERKFFIPDGENSVAHGILPCAVPRILERLSFVGFPQLSNIVCQRIVRVRCRKKSLKEIYEINV